MENSKIIGTFCEKCRNATCICNKRLNLLLKGKEVWIDFKDWNFLQRYKSGNLTDEESRDIR